jgi:hypothetical protein
MKHETVHYLIYVTNISRQVWCTDDVKQRFMETHVCPCALAPSHECKQDV